MKPLRPHGEGHTERKGFHVAHGLQNFGGGNNSKEKNYICIRQRQKFTNNEKLDLIYILQYMKRIMFFVAAVTVIAATACSQYKYETVAGDPLGTKMYTLDNGLKVYMSVNKETPRIQTYIAVRVGGKNDPSETTGLAHYFEHLMFKGTPNYGTSDYAAEKPMLDEIENLFEVYRQTEGEAERAAIYHQIDSISYEASKLAIPNEYDKLMSIIGAQGTNAFTSQDMTVYVEDIPSNEIDNWARIEAACSLTTLTGHRPYSAHRST